MTYRAPTIDDFNHSRWLRRGFELPELFDPLLDRMAEEIRTFAGRADRKDVNKNIKTTVSVILANVYRSYCIDPNRYIIVQLGNADYPNGPSNPLKLNPRVTRAVIDYLCQENFGYLFKRGGNFDRDRNIGYPTRIRAREQLVTEIEDFLFKEDDDCKIDNIRLTRNTLYNNPSSPELSFLFKNTALPSIRLKGPKPIGGGSAPMQKFKPTAETEQMGANVDSINRYIQDHCIDLLIPDDEFRTLSMTSDDDVDEFGDERENRLDMDLIFGKSLYRVFNNGTFGEGGRFYGGWWQSIPRKARKYLTINWYPTAELDYSNMQIAMLYAKEGLALKGDAYSIDGINPNYRDLIKRTLLKVINATGKFRPPRIAEVPDGWKFSEIVEAVEAKHAPIAKHFRTGIGIQLQRRDADIAERVMLTMMAEGILALPVHDSFIVEDGKQERLREVMAETFQGELGQEIGIDANPTLFQELPSDNGLATMFGFDSHFEYRLALDKEGVQSLEDVIGDIEERPEYENYRQRKKDFLRYCTADWDHNHHFYF